LKTLNESFTDQEFERLKQAKNLFGKNWHDYIMTFAMRPKPVLRHIFSSADGDFLEQHALWCKKHPELAKREAEGLPCEEAKTK